MKKSRFRNTVLKPHSLLIGLIILLIPLLFIGGYYSLTGLVVYDIYVNQTFNESTNLSLRNAPQSFGLNGKILGGAARIYLANSTILDSSLLPNSTFTDYCLGGCAGGAGLTLYIEVENGSIYLEGLSDAGQDEAPFWDSVPEEFVVAVGGVLIVDLDNYFTDNENTGLVYLATSSSHFNISITGSIMTVVPAGNKSASENITIMVSDMKNTLRKEMRIRSDFIDSVRQEALNSPVALDEAVISRLEVSPEVSVIVPSAFKELGLVEKPSEEFSVGMEYDYSSGRNLSKLNMMSMKITRSGLEKLKKNKRIEGVFLDKEFDLAVMDGLALINAVEASKISTGRVGVCLLDTGVNWNATGYNFVDDNSNISDGNGHGTLVGKVLKATAPDASIIAVKVCNAKGKCLGSDVLEGLNYCLEEKVQMNISVISGSFGDRGEYTPENCPSDFGDTFDVLDSAGIASVFAAGNDFYRNGVNFPACDPAVIGVGASDKRGGIALFSNLDSGLLLAPGENLNISGEVASGTSFSAGFVSGGVAMLKGINSSLNTPSVYLALFESGTRIGNYSRINLAEALKNITHKEVFFVRQCDDSGNCLVQSEMDLLYPCLINGSAIICPALDSRQEAELRTGLNAEDRKTLSENGVPLKNKELSELRIIINDSVNMTSVTTGNETYYMNPAFAYRIELDLAKKAYLKIGFG